MYNIAIVEDDAKDSALLEKYLGEYSEESGETFSVSSFSDPLVFLGGYDASYDIVFMDIMLPGQNGVETARELRELDEIIGKLAERLNKGGRICVITFHSLEDRIVKREFQYLEAKCICPPKQPVCTCNKVQTVKIITKKPLTVSEEELAVNPRAQSAKLRVAERV